MERDGLRLQGRGSAVDERARHSDARLSIDQLSDRARAGTRVCRSPLPVRKPEAGALRAYLSRMIEARVPGYRMLGYFENGYRHVSNRLRPVHTPADMKGLRIRSLPSRMHARTYELLGAVPLMMDLKPAIAAIKAGEIDAQENPLANTVDYGVHKLHRYHTLTGHSYLSRGIYCNRARDNCDRSACDSGA